MVSKATKDLLWRLGIYPFARSIYRTVSPRHRNERQLRTRFFAQLIQPGDLCFDIGANLGQSIESFLECRGRVIALEPNPLCLPTLQRDFGRNPNVVLVNKAVGREPGVAQLHFHGTGATASLRDNWYPGDDQTADIEVVTLENLIASHGIPQLLKVDVEGFETEVFAGLAQPIPTIYFEMHHRELDAVRTVVARLASLGQIKGINAVSEDHAHWLLEEWLAPQAFLARLESLPAVANVIVRMR